MRALRPAPSNRSGSRLNGWCRLCSPCSWPTVLARRRGGACYCSGSMTKHILALVLALVLFPILTAGQSPETTQALDDLERMIQQSLSQVGVVRATVTPPPPVDCQVSEFSCGDWVD